MFSQFLANFTFLDAIIAVIIVWTCCSGFRNGTFIEIFKIAALICAVFIGLHFYLRLSEFFNGLLRILHPVSQVLSYVLLIGICVGIFRIFRDGLVIFLKQEDLKIISKCVGAVFGILRAFLLGSILLVGCLLIDHMQVTRVVRNSFTSQFLLTVSTSIYSGIFHTVVKPVFSGEEENTQIINAAQQNHLRPD